MIFGRNANQPATAEPTNEVPSRSEFGIRPPESAGGIRKKILVVDDDPITLRALTHKLKSRGFCVVTASDASEALSATVIERPDLLLLDVNLPSDAGPADWNGLLVAQWLQRMEKGRNMPVIVMSASDREEHRERAMIAGAAAFFCKQTDNNQLLASIDSALRGYSTGEPAKPAAVFDI